ncbi:hypothetical protein [Clostridium sp. BSD9I1]|uniref:hypothetical protein n=1 Tax=Clostridium sp. BSD9I1 TaxID=2003589 RepID=UPI001644403E|nr:hypothetical protein [Clostridium sp. BSD9I1]
MAIVCSAPVTVENCDLCVNIPIVQTLTVNSATLITVTATVTDICVGRTLSVGAILCEITGEGEEEERNVIATQVIAEPVLAPDDDPEAVCTDVTRTFAFLVPTICDPEEDPRVFVAAVVAHYILEPGCPCPCELIDNGEG